MTKPKHTPGPWLAVCRDVNYSGGEWDEGSFLQWDVVGPRHPTYGRGEYYQYEANIIAAAPDMAETLSELIEAIDKKYTHETQRRREYALSPRIEAALEAGRAALAKARGEKE